MQHRCRVWVAGPAAEQAPLRSHKVLLRNVHRPPKPCVCAEVRCQLLLWLPSLFTQSYEELHAAEAFPLADAPECDGKEVGGFWVVERACVRCVPMCVCVGVSVCNNDRHSIGIPSVRRSSVDQDSSRVTSCKRAARHSHAAPSDCHPPAIRLLKRRPLVGGPQETNFVHIPGSFLLGGARRATSEPLPPVCFISSSPRNLFGFTSFPAASAIR